MKKLNAKGFTLIELLAVITIMGVLMIVAIPTVGRTIDNTRRDTFLDTAKQYVNGVKTMWLSDSLECQTESNNAGSYTPVSALGAASAETTVVYYVKINSNAPKGPGTDYPEILESGGKSSWGSRHVYGYVKIAVTGDATTGVTKQQYYIRLTDGGHGIIDTGIEYSQLKRGNVLVSAPTLTGDGVGPWGTNAKLIGIETPAAEWETEKYTAGSNYKDTAPKFCREI